MLGCGEGPKEALRPDFKRSILVDFLGAKISSNAGFLLLGRRMNCLLPSARSITFTSAPGFWSSWGGASL